MADAGGADGIARFAQAAVSTPSEMLAIAPVVVAGGLVLVSC